MRRFRGLIGFGVAAGIVLALVPVVREAGGEFSDWDGRVTAFGNGATATNGALAGSLRARLGVPWPTVDETPTSAPGATHA